MREKPYDCRSGFNREDIWALRMVGVNLIEHLWHSGRRKDHCIRFTFHGDKEMAKGIIQDFIEDHFEGTNCRFYQDQHATRFCYVAFDEGRLERYGQGETHASES